MTYVDGFVTAVPAANKDAYCRHARAALPIFKEHGATRMVETWGDDVPDGKITDFRRAVRAEEGEVVVFSWVEYPDKATRDAANDKLMGDPRLLAIAAAMPFDGKRMIYAGFDTILDAGPRGAMGYADGLLIPVPHDRQEAYRTMAARTATIFQDHGAIRLVEAWGSDVPDGAVTDYKRAVQAQADENIVFSWIEWPSKEARNAGWAAIMADDRMKDPPADMPMDGKRMIYGGFASILDA